jgi:signal transduction histidine kinase
MPRPAEQPAAPAPAEPCPAVSPAAPDDRARSTELAALAGGLAHEIKNPLSTIGLNLDLLAEDLEDPQTPRDHRMLKKVRNVRQECDRLGEILDAFLRFAKAGEPELETCDLNDVVREFLDFYRPAATAAGIDVSPHLAADLPPARLDRGLMRQVLLNLALNAQQAMPHGGLLEIQTGCNEAAKPGGRRVELRVIDNGCGMDSDTLSRMWQTFFSRKPAGSGLGLPTVRRIIEAHAGTVTCDSAVGQGTRFTITLPAA